MLEGAHFTRHSRRDWSRYWLRCAASLLSHIAQSRTHVPDYYNCNCMASWLADCWETQWLSVYVMPMCTGTMLRRLDCSVASMLVPDWFSWLERRLPCYL